MYIPVDFCSHAPERVLHAGCDIYFCNHLPPGKEVKTYKDSLLYETTIK